MSQRNFTQNDTSPSAKQWCSPPEEVENYTVWLINALSLSQGTMQYFSMLSRLMKLAGTSANYPKDKPVIKGIYADELTAAATLKFERICKDARDRRAIRIDADETLNKRLASEKSHDSESSTATKTRKTNAKRSGPSTSELVDEWEAPSKAKQANKAFMAMFKQRSAGR